MKLQNHDAQFFSGSGFPDDVEYYHIRCGGLLVATDWRCTEFVCDDCNEEVAI